MNQFDQIHSDLLQRLSQGKRSHLELSQEVLSDIEHRWRQALDQKQPQELDALMCVLEHARHPHKQFEELFFSTLENEVPPKQIIFTLAASWKHLLERWARAGDRVPPRYLEVLRQLLKHKDFEVREWTLRTLDQVGPQGRLLMADIRAANTSWSKFFNPHAKAIAQLVEMFEKRWKAR